MLVSSTHSSILSERGPIDMTNPTTTGHGGLNSHASKLSQLLNQRGVQSVMVVDDSLDADPEQGWIYRLQPMMIFGQPLKTPQDLRSGSRRMTYSRQIAPRRQGGAVP